MDLLSTSLKSCSSSYKIIGIAGSLKLISKNYMPFKPIMFVFP